MRPLRFPRMRVKMLLRRLAVQLLPPSSRGRHGRLQGSGCSAARAALAWSGVQKGCRDVGVPSPTVCGSASLWTLTMCPIFPLHSQGGGEAAVRYEILLKVL